jgi:hypothetical protein
VVAEGKVLLGVEQLEQRGRRVALEPATELVHLVDQHHWVAALHHNYTINLDPDFCAKMVECALHTHACARAMLSCMCVHVAH